jgi:hypothetical protein
MGGESGEEAEMETVLFEMVIRESVVSERP